ncbi:MAG: HRDC domain-containing protein, partial [Geobacteraceae bacterium]
GETPVMLGLPRDVAKAEEKTRRRSGAGEGAHRELFDELRSVRKKIADAASVPPFVVFSDATLVEMAKSRPMNERELLSITGVGEHKLRKYGATFMAAIGAYLERTGASAPAPNEGDINLVLSDTQRNTYLLYQEGLSLEDISSRRGLKDTTIVSHLEELLAAGLDIDLRRFVAADKIPLIEARLEELGTVNLSALKEGLPESISYSDLRLIRGAWRK